jgi:hypothetical protein
VDKVCGNCSRRRQIIYLGVRFYQKRHQDHYQLRVCKECFDVLRTMVESAAYGSMHGLFDHSLGVPSEEALPAENGHARFSHH